ncbi:MAG: hypothetical protein Harvfovirus18_23 [Harvfovirus sp.]|uniref:Uncharacterized protein n=1 Tax=Harvfovirus sp. TaxID=2487768 RepID=A0A3G5A1S5_9VIRU|nr:MAG: hypothetical protein Harvfovirus18_23 [Harvfovirus sp.]
MEYLNLGLEFLKENKIRVNKNDILEWFVLRLDAEKLIFEVIMLFSVDDDIEVLMLDIYGSDALFSVIPRESILEFKVFREWLICYRKTLLGLNHSLSKNSAEHVLLAEKLGELTHDSNLKEYFEMICEYIRVAMYAVEDTKDEERDLQVLPNAFFLL